MRKPLVHCEGVGGNEADDETREKNMSKIENTTLAQDVSESARTNTLIHVDAPIMTIADVMSALSVMDGVGDYDHARENDGTYDVWGTVYGDNFRLRVTTMETNA